MATEPGTMIAAATAAAPSVLATATASAFEVSRGDYVAATVFSLIGIVARHFTDAAKNEKFNFKALAFDIPTAPMLGIVAYIGCIYFKIEPLIVPGIVIFLSFLGPEWLRTLGNALIDVITGKLKGNSP